MPRLFELQSDGTILPGIANKDHVLVLGDSFINDPAPTLFFSPDIPQGRVFEAEFEDGGFYPQQFQESRIIILIRDQCADEGRHTWDIFHMADPMCEEPHSPGVACIHCTDRKQTEFKRCGHICRYCNSRLKNYPRRVHTHDLDIIARHYHYKAASRMSEVRKGMELIMYLSPGESVKIIRYARAWWKYMHRLLTFDVEGCLRIENFSDKEIAKPESVWL